ncbi:unnamed protein product [Amoebophrya sp. A25]|nr:unnamed protein product [Amoebophrya sp. A25]|eukprot:GSA25T00022146001.1
MSFVAKPIETPGTWGMHNNENLRPQWRSDSRKYITYPKLRKRFSADGQRRWHFELPCAHGQGSLVLDSE